jgi:MFS family permease
VYTDIRYTLLQLDVVSNLGSSRRSAIVSIVISCLFFMYGCIARTEPSILIDDLIRDFGSTASVIGFVISIVYIPYIVMQIPYGFLIDKFGLRAAITTGCLLCSAGVFVFGSAGSIWQLEMGRFLVGSAAASGFLCCGKAALRYQDQGRYGFIMGLANVAGMIGGAFGSAPLVPLVSCIGWRGTTFMISAFGLILLVLAVTFVGGGGNERPERSEKGSVMNILKMIVRKPQVWLLGIYGFMAEMPITAVAELWGVQFMVHRFEIPEKIASLSSTAMFMAFGLGAVISGWLVDKVRSCKPVMVISALGMATTFVSAVYLDSIEFKTCIILLSFTSIFAGSNLLCFSAVFRFVSKEFGGTVTGFMNALVMSSGLVAQPILGKLLDFFRNGLVTEAGEPVYNLPMYRSTFAFVVLCLMVAIVIPFFIKESERKVARG